MANAALTRARCWKEVAVMAAEQGRAPLTHPRAVVASSVQTRHGKHGLITHLLSQARRADHHQRALNLTPLTGCHEPTNRPQVHPQGRPLP